MRHHPQLDLRIVGAHQQVAVRRDEGPPDGAALRRAERDVLQVGVARGEPPRGRHRLVERGVHAAIRPASGRYPIRHRGQRVEVGGLELAERPVFEQQLRERVLRGQLLEHALVGREAGLRPPAGLQLELLEQHARDLRPAVEVEALVGQHVERLLEPGDVFGGAARHLGQHPTVERDPRALHLEQHPDERVLEPGVEIPLLPRLELGPERRLQSPEHGRRGRSEAPRDRGRERRVPGPGPAARRRRLELGQGLAEKVARQRRQRVVALRIAEERAEVDVEGQSAEPEPGAFEHVAVGLQVVPHLGHREVGERRREPLTHLRERQVGARIVGQRHVAGGPVARREREPHQPRGSRLRTVRERQQRETVQRAGPHLVQLLRPGLEQRHFAPWLVDLRGGPQIERGLPARGRRGDRRDRRRRDRGRRDWSRRRRRYLRYPRQRERDTLGRRLAHRAPPLGGPRRRERARVGIRHAQALRHLLEPADFVALRELEQRVAPHRTAAQLLPGVRQVEVGAHRRQLAREEGQLAVRLQLRLERGLLHLGQPRVDRVERAELAHQLLRGLLPHARHARDVVARIAHQGEHVADVLGPHLPLRAHRVGVHPLVGLARLRHQHAHRPAHDLEHVLVAGDHKSLMTGLLR